CSLLFLYRCPAHRDLHSFPTRRSSDLFRHAAQGLEEKKQILYLLGPVGGGKSSIAERLKQLMEHVPFYSIKGSPVNESPLGLFRDRKSTRLNSSHVSISYAVFCLKKKR